LAPAGFKTSLQCFGPNQYTEGLKNEGSNLYVIKAFHLVIPKETLLWFAESTKTLA
jgi:hypothetical protein